MFTTSLQTSAAKFTSVPVKLSGEYSKRQLVLLYFFDSSLIRRAPSIAIFLMPSLSSSNTTFR